MVTNLYDFRGGYAIDLPPERMEGTMLTIAQNLYWRDGLQKRQGVSTHITSDITGTVAILGMTRQYLNSIWYTLAALENASGDVTFYYGFDGGGTLAQLASSPAWTSGKKVEFAMLDSKVVAVNGSDKPIIIYYDGGWTVQNLETFDARTRLDDDWWAGEYDPSGDVYTDDTTDAQSTGATADFLVAPAASNSGCYVAGTFTYNKIVFNNMVSPASGTVTYEYYKGDDIWGTMDVATTPAWTSGDMTLEWNYPSDWAAWDGDEDTLSGRYLSRLKFAGARATDGVSCTHLEISHTQYLTQIMANERPSTVWTHLNRLYLAAKNNVNFSPPYRLTDWNEYDVEVFEQGGDEVKAMRSLGQSLVVIKEGAVYTYEGNTWENREVNLRANIGTINGRTCEVVNGVLFFLAKDGIRYFYGSDSKLISKHINTDVLSYTATNANAVNYRGEYLLCFPSNEVALWFDPDTLRTDDRGDGRVSFYKFTNMTFDVMNWCSGGSDDGSLLGAQNASSRTFKKLQNGNYYDGTSTDIAIIAKTKDYSFDEPLTRKLLRRVKADMSKSGNYTFRIYDEYSQNYTEVTMQSGAGTGHYYEYVSVPYTMDGNTFALYMANTGSVDVTLYGFSIEGKGRIF